MQRSMRYCLVCASMVPAERRSSSGSISHEGVIGPRARDSLARAELLADDDEADDADDADDADAGDDIDGRALAVGCTTV